MKEAKNLSKNNKKPILIADIWDNPGGGVPGDSTTLIKKANINEVKKYCPRLYLGSFSS